MKNEMKWKNEMAKRMRKEWRKKEYNVEINTDTKSKVPEWAKVLHKHTNTHTSIENNTNACANARQQNEKMWKEKKWCEVFSIIREKKAAAAAGAAIEKRWRGIESELVFNEITSFKTKEEN